MENKNTPTNESIDIEESNDKIIEKDYLKATAQQKESQIAFYVDNIFEDEDKLSYKNRLKLKKEPPVLVFQNTEGEKVSLELTENFNDELIETLKEVKRAYYGFSSPKDIHAPEGFFNKLKYYSKKNKLKLIVAFLLVLYLIALNLI